MWASGRPGARLTRRGVAASVERTIRRALRAVAAPREEFMRRLHGVLTAIALSAVATQTGAADITRVKTGGEVGNPFELELSARWDRFQERATISHESAKPSSGAPGG